MNVRKRLLELKDEKYRKFHSALVPGIDNVLGVRVPELRKIAKEFVKTGGWQKYNDSLYYEELMIQGLLIGYAKLKTEEKLNLLRDFIPKITSWGVCDVVCSTLKFPQKDKELVLEFLQPYLKSNKEYQIRFGVVMLLNYFIQDKYIDKIFQILDGIKHDGYYAKMAVAWALSICFVKYWDKTFEYFKHSNLNSWVYNKAIQKACESFRISDENKEVLKKMKK